MKELKINGLHVYDYEGSGFPLIFIHAFPMNNKIWNPQIEFFKDKFRVITYDIRGLGKSKSDNNQFTMERYADDLLMIIEKMELDKTLACGLSMGGYILLRSYVKRPDKFKALILADTRAERDDDIGLINRSNVITDILSGKKQEFIDSFLVKLINKASYENKALRSFLEELISNNTSDGICGAQLALATRVNSIGYLSSFNIPSLIIVGEDDILTPIKSSENMNSLIKNSELKVIPNSGHMSNLENPEAFNNCVMEFLSKLH